MFESGLGVRQDLEHAAHLYEKAVYFGANCHSNFGQVLKELGNSRAAEEMFQQSNSPSALFNLALMKKEAGSWMDAEALYWEAHGHGNAVATYNLASMYAGDSDWMTRKDEKLAEQLYLEVVGRDFVHCGT